MVVEDFQQVRPTDRLPGKESDTIAVDCFLRPFPFVGFLGEGQYGHRLIPGAWGTLARRSVASLPISSSTTPTVDGDDCDP